MLAEFFSRAIFCSKIILYNNNTTYEPDLEMAAILQEKNDRLKNQTKQNAGIM